MTRRMSRIGPLSLRQQQILHLMARGRSNADIGRRLEIPEGTVKSNIWGIFGKLGARTRAHAVALGFQFGYLQAPCGCQPRREGAA